MNASQSGFDRVARPGPTLRPSFAPAAPLMRARSSCPSAPPPRRAHSSRTRCRSLVASVSTSPRLCVGVSPPRAAPPSFDGSVTSLSLFLLLVSRAPAVQMKGMGGMPGMGDMGGGEGEGGEGGDSDDDEGDDDDDLPPLESDDLEPVD